MSKNILIISTSPRKEGNSQILAEEFGKGAASNGNEVVQINLYDKDIKFCKGCLACQKKEGCIIKDDMADILEKVIISDVLVFATPIYFYEMCGQMKTFLDRTNPIFPKEYKFKDIYLIGAAAETENTAMNGCIKGLEGWIECFDKARLAGVVHGLGLESVGDSKNNDKLLAVAYDMGKKVK